jgi:hypothetical protein
MKRRLEFLDAAIAEEKKKTSVQPLGQLAGSNSSMLPLGTPPPLSKAGKPVS